MEYEFFLALGVDSKVSGYRVCVLGVGPFLDQTSAVAFAEAVRGFTAAYIEATHDNVEWHDAVPEPVDVFLPIVGATLEVVSREYGTQWDLTRDLY